MSSKTLARLERDVALCALERVDRRPVPVPTDLERQLSHTPRALQELAAERLPHPPGPRQKNFARHIQSRMQPRRNPFRPFDAPISEKTNTLASLRKKKERSKLYIPLRKHELAGGLGSPPPPPFEARLTPSAATVRGQRQST